LFQFFYARQSALSTQNTLSDYLVSVSTVSVCVPVYLFTARSENIKAIEIDFLNSFGVYKQVSTDKAFDGFCIELQQLGRIRNTSLYGIHGCAAAVACLYLTFVPF